jgi:gas vesicle protein
MSKDDNSVVFGLGLLAGILGGVVAAILYAPKSGEETREEMKAFVNDFAQKHAPEIKEAKKQALESLDMMKYKLEKQYNKINEHIKAKQMAKAKEMEDRSYDLN